MENAPLVALLTPVDGAALNAAELRVQALVAAFTPHPRNSFVFNGQTVAGRNVGRISRVEIALDGVAVEQVDVDDCRRQVAIDSRIDLTGVAPGFHTIMVTAAQGHPHAGLDRSVSATFNLDQTLPLAEVNRVEEAATPEPFACLSVPDDNDDEDHERNWQRPKRLRLEGRFVLGQQSDGIDLTRDRVVIALGSHLTVLEPGMLRCRGRQKGECRFQDRSQPLVQDVKLEKKHDGTWRFEITGSPVPPESDRFYVRIGDDWGGMDLGTGELLASLRPALDTNNQAQASIGVEGGTIQSPDANRVLIRLDVPPSALTQDTSITITPLLTSPLLGSSTALHPGVKFEPEGLVFAKPATLTLDFSATDEVIADDQFIFLLTSPMTALPLYGSVDPGAKTLMALLSHFSTGQGGSGNTAQSDPAVWINSVLAAPGALSLSELRSVLAAWALAQRLQVDGNVNTSLLSQKVQESLDAMAAANCQADVANPSESALQRWIDLATLGQLLGANTGQVGGCLAQVLEARIRTVGGAAQNDPSDANLQRLLTLSSRAQGLGLSNLETLALELLADALRAILNTVPPLCSTDPEVATAELNRALGWAGVVATVDSSLAADLQSAIDNCQRRGAGQMTVRVDMGTVEAMDSIAVPPRFDVWSSLFGRCDTIMGVPVPCVGTTSPPATINNATLLSVLNQPAPDTLVWEATSSYVAGDKYPLTADFAGELTFTQAGTLTVQVNPAWPLTHCRTFQPRDEDGTPHGQPRTECVTHSVRATVGGSSLVYGSTTEPTPPATESTTINVPISGPGSVPFSLWMQFWFGFDEPNCPNGSGPMVTLTFTPSR